MVKTRLPAFALRATARQAIEESFAFNDLRALLLVLASGSEAIQGGKLTCFIFLMSYKWVCPLLNKARRYVCRVHSFVVKTFLGFNLDCFAAARNDE